jgi:hypothetical protein
MSPQRLASDSYYQFTAHEAVAAGETYTFFTRPALDSQQENLTSALLLAESIDLAPGAQALVMHCGGGLAGAVAARQAHPGCQPDRKRPGAGQRLRAGSPGARTHYGTRTDLRHSAGLAAQRPGRLGTDCP